jgi:hypothetical protein
MLISVDNLISTPTQRIVFFILITYIYLFIINKKLYLENILYLYLCYWNNKKSYMVYMFVNWKCVYLFSLLQYTWDRILKKWEMSKLAVFEPRIFQLLVRNLTASANSFEKYSHIIYNLNLAH